MSTSIVPLIIHGQDVGLTDELRPTTFESNPHIYDQFPERKRWVIQGATPELAVKAVIRARSHGLSAIIEEELSCSKLWAAMNTEETIALAEYVASLPSSECFAPRIPEIRSHESHAVIVKAPLGVVLGIAPWNSPAILGLRAVAAAVMAGNCAILKGSELSPRTHHFISDAFRDAGFPPGVLNSLVHRPEDAASVYEAIISHPAVKKCNFTGSTPVGRQIAMRAAYYLKPVVLELGGKNFAVVLDDADLDSAADRILEGALVNSGQVCMSTDIVLASKSILPKLCVLLRGKLREHSSRHTRRLINAGSAARVTNLLKDALTKGAVLHSASPAISGEFDTSAIQYGTIIENLSRDMDFWEQESFGPLLGVMAVEGLEDAIGIINACPYGLSTAIFSLSGLNLMDQAKKLEVGAIHINGSTVHDEPTLPHGGCKNSGWGRLGGYWAVEEFMQTRTIIFNR
ncbi:Vanillin dehydrogenase [Paramyrothecium foliicola]|nr:Vanillin dehydrogenase [Paramyrothecium foliicola]